MFKVKQRLFTALTTVVQAGAIFVLSTSGGQALSQQEVGVVLAVEENSYSNAQCVQLGSSIPTSGGAAQSLWGDGVALYKRDCSFNYDTDTPAWTQEFRITYFTWNTFYIKTDRPGKCLEVENGSTADGAVIRQRSCNGSLHQRWMMEDYSTDEWRADIKFRSVLSGKCIEHSDGVLRQGSCSTSYNRLNILPTGTDIRIRTGWSGRCLDVHNVGDPEGAKVQQWDCLSYYQSNQKWLLDFVSFPYQGFCSGQPGGCVWYNAIYQLRPMHTNMGLRADTYDFPPSNGTPVVQSYYGEGWTLFPEYYYGLRFRIRGQRGGLCLDVDNRSNVNGAKVQVWECNGWSNQTWRFWQLSP